MQPLSHCIHFSSYLLRYENTLKLEIQLPCGHGTHVLEISGELPDSSVYLRLKLCTYCNSPFIPIKINQRFCAGTQCRMGFNRLIRLKAKANSLERYTTLEIYERDEWKCGICGGEVSPEFKWRHPLSGSLDHIIPVSKGGSDTKANVRLAHWECNRKKGNRVPWEN